MQDKPTDVLDHLIFKIETGKLDEGVARFKKMGFNPIPGGFYGGEIASNALIVLADGVYIELFAYTHEPSHYPPGSPERKARENHPWAKSSPGWADFTHLDLAAAPSDTYKVVNQRIGHEVYRAPLYAGRTRPDGVELKNAVTFPDWTKYGVGNIPYFAQDLTPRRLRVPMDPPSNIHHPNGAKGIASIKVFTTATKFQAQIRLLSAAVGAAPAKPNDSTAVWNLASPNPRASTSPILILAVAPKGVQIAAAGASGGGGIAEVSLWFDTGSGVEVVREEVLRLGE